MAVDAVIIGLGYVGLPLAQEAFRAGLTVLGHDIHEVDSVVRTEGTREQVSRL